MENWAKVLRKRRKSMFQQLGLFYPFLGTLFLILSLIETLITFRVFHRQFTLGSKILFQILLGAIFIFAGEHLDIPTAILLFVLYLSFFVFAYTILGIELHPLKGWGMSILIGIIGGGLVGFVVLKALQWEVAEVLSLALGITSILEGLLLGYLSLGVYRQRLCLH
jgi:hypothetical protein